MLAYLSQMPHWLFIGFACKLCELHMHATWWQRANIEMLAHGASFTCFICCWPSTKYEEKPLWNLSLTLSFKSKRYRPGKRGVGDGFDTHVFLLGEYFIELNTANFKISNKSMNWILSGNRKLNQLLNWILLKNENWINVWIEFVEKQTN